MYKLYFPLIFFIQKTLVTKNQIIEEYRAKGLKV